MRMKMSDRGPESVSATDVEMVKAHAKEKGNNCKKKKSFIHSWPQF